MPAAVWRTRPARSISLWLTIWASAGLSLRSGRKARDQRMAAGSRGRVCRLQPQWPCGAADTGAAQTQAWLIYIRDKEPGGRLVSTLPNALTLGSGSGPRLTTGDVAATHPRGLASNRHAGRPDRWSIRAFAFLALKSGAPLVSFS